MRKIALFVALAAIAATPAMAQGQKKAAKKEDPQVGMTAAQKANDNSYRLVRDSLPLWLPSWAQPVYHYGVKPKMEADAKPAKAKKAKTAKSQ
jgi:hypothetical protein